MMFSELSISKKIQASRAQQACFFYDSFSAAAFAAFFLPVNFLSITFTLTPFQ